METYLQMVETKTGKTPDDFKSLATEKGLVKRGDIIAWLKDEFELPPAHANAVVNVILNADAPEVNHDDAIAKHFTSIKSVWREPFDSLVLQLKEFGADVKLSPAKTFINVLRNDKRFAIVQVSAKRLDVGIKLNGTAPKGRFEQAGAWNPLVTHRVKVDHPDEINGELLLWLRQAYDKA